MTDNLPSPLPSSSPIPMDAHPMREDDACSVATSTAPTLAGFGVPPWLQDLRSSSTSNSSSVSETNPMRALGRELNAFSNYVCIQPSERIVHEWLIGRVRDEILFPVFGRPPSMQAAEKVLLGTATTEEKAGRWADVVPYGGFRTGLSLVNSGLDLLLVAQGHADSSKEAMMSRIEEQIRKKGVMFKMDLYKFANARVPMVKYKDKRSLVDVVIALGTKEDLLSTELQMTYLADERTGGAIRCLTVFLKYLLMQRGLNNQVSGGLSAYTLTLMVVSFIQMHPLLKQHPELNPVDCLGPMLFDCLSLYGKHFKYESHGIDLRDGGGYFKKANGGLELYVRDPITPERNTAERSFRLKEVKHAFSEAQKELQEITRTYLAEKPAKMIMLQKVVSIQTKIKQVRKQLLKVWANMNRGRVPESNFKESDLRINHLDQVWWDLGRGVERPRSSASTPRSRYTPSPSPSPRRDAPWEKRPYSGSSPYRPDREFSRDRSGSRDREMDSKRIRY